LVGLSGWLDFPLGLAGAGPFLLGADCGGNWGSSSSSKLPELLLARPLRLRRDSVGAYSVGRSSCLKLYGPVSSRTS
jgi:hypothetical protein